MIIPTGYAQANYFFTGVALPTGAQITMGYDIGEFAGTASDAAETLANLWASEDMDNFQVNGCALTKVLVKFGPNSTGPSGEYPTTVTGFEDHESVPPNTSALVRKITDSGGHAGRGRFYIPCIRENLVAESGALDTGWLAARQPNLDDWLAGQIAADLPPVVLHGEDSPLTIPSPINALVLDSRVATQRRRLRR